MTWREVVEGTRLSDPSVRCVLAAPASATALRQAEEALGRPLPGDLASLLVEADGIDLQMDVGGETIPYQSLIWPVAQVRRFNVSRKRANRPPERNLVFFSEAGNGDLFALASADAADDLPSGGVVLWNHEENTYRLVAHSLKEFIDGWLGGQLTV